jgi:predicted Rossmann fold nucleotide-binding protein DprA/Smf involved in DNA uptake
MSIGFPHKIENSFSSSQGVDPRYSAMLRAFLGADAPPAITALGDLALLDRRPLAIFCSSRCPGSLIVQASDLAHALRDRGAAVIGGFHTPVEAACLEILLAGAGPLIVCPPRGMYKTIPTEFRKPLAAGRLLLLSPFDEAERRVTAELAAYRNRFVAALAERVLFVHAALGGRTAGLAREVIGWCKPVWALTHETNAHLFSLGALDASLLVSEALSAGG